MTAAARRQYKTRCEFHCYSVFIWCSTICCMATLARENRSVSNAPPELLAQRPTLPMGGEIFDLGSVSVLPFLSFIMPSALRWFVELRILDGGLLKEHVPPTAAPSSDALGILRVPIKWYAGLFLVTRILDL